MKKFKSMSEVTDWQFCRKKPILVGCKQVNEEFRVDSLEGDYAHGKAGDYLMLGIENELYICDKKIFEKSYEVIC